MRDRVVVDGKDCLKVRFLTREVRSAVTFKLHRVTEVLDVNDADLSGSRFNDANLSGTTFNQINFSGASFNDSNMTGWRVNDVNLSGSVFQNLNLSGAALNNCRLDGVTIDGVPFADILAAFRKSLSSGN